MIPSRKQQYQKASEHPINFQLALAIMAEIWLERDHGIQQVTTSTWLVSSA